ncbi:molecular chaperone [Acinetobacter sp. WCHAc060025]|uniref:fimbrial biogenesis chaperone n=1 Tax=Acinetobacter sp. WCHAc060025 TaxID=2518625 RepID=UPI0010230129|nr:fimbria/pilus periplasmic chaperone [Acinetobacter sp. WCHAc060025]RZG74490.1 molecular chaperone [Acinetobacter sp. WCHAc060025]
MNKIIFTLLLGLYSAPVLAGLDFDPVQMYLKENSRQRSATITLSSKDVPQEKIFEMSAMKWTQNDKGEDVLEPDHNILINPKNFVIKPESKQIVRVGFTQPLTSEDLQNEQTWRIFFKEVTPVVEQTGMTFLFNVSVPFFVGKQDKADLVVQAKQADKNLIINLKNNANSHIQISKLEILDANKKSVALKSEMKYLLKGQKHDFDLGTINLGDLSQYKLMIFTDKSDLPLEMKIKG